MKKIAGKNKKNAENYDSVMDGLCKLYTARLLPLEETYKFFDFHSPQLEKSDFDSKPMIIFVGQYSTGKTTMIRYLLEQDYVNMRIGPEPTTDGIVVIMEGETNRNIPGNAAVSDNRKPFKTLTNFGNSFLTRFNCVEMNNEVLKGVTLVDTPGILAGEKQASNRGYDFSGVLRWFCERCHRIILLFDAHKLDISDEFKQCIDVMKPFEEKIRIVLNKADGIDRQQLMRVYGSLMWSLSKVITSPEVSRVYIGSFWDSPLKFDDNRKLFELEESDFFNDLMNVPRDSALQNINNFIKRAKLAKVHAYLISYMCREMPMFGKDKKKAEFVNDVPALYKAVQSEFKLPLGDFPDAKKFSKDLESSDFSKFAKLNPKLISNLEKILAEDIGKLMDMIPTEMSMLAINDCASIHGGVFGRSTKAVEESIDNPFSSSAQIGFNAGINSERWAVESKKAHYDAIFHNLPLENGKLLGASARNEFAKTKLSNKVLAKIWNLSDIDGDGKLDDEEFALAMYICDLKLQGEELPQELPYHLVPPGKRMNRR